MAGDLEERTHHGLDVPVGRPHLGELERGDAEGPDVRCLVVPALGGDHLGRVRRRARAGARVMTRARLMTMARIFG